MLRAIRHIVLAVIDFFHRPFARWIDKQTFRYLASGGSGAVLNIGVYWFSYHFLFHEQDVHTPFMLVRSAVAAAVVAFFVSTPYGFMMSRYIVFPESNLKGRVQLFRYLITVGACAILTYFFVPFFHYTCGIYATPSSILTNIVVALFSYVAQRFFTFKVKPEEPTWMQAED
ncbi:MAG: GtrA family protein [Bacteroidetes bacterium]|nr:GtrA family protein [Bacteroidota bacterium]MBS1628519.1 GtrA family protein [Bacteroidota bacterium]